MNQEIEDERILRRIKANKNKTAIEQVQPYLKLGYCIVGSYLGGSSSSNIEKSQILACGDCGNTGTYYKLTQYKNAADKKLISTINVCSRCNGTDIKLMNIRRAKNLNVKFTFIRGEKI